MTPIVEIVDLTLEDITLIEDLVSVRNSLGLDVVEIWTDLPLENYAP